MESEVDGAGGKAKRGAFDSRLGFILAAAGSAVGLGNLWRFPYLTYKFGGGAGEKSGAGTFILLYLLCIVLVCLPVIIAEILVGRRGRRNPVGSFNAIRPRTRWNLVGYLGILTGFLILSYYTVVAGWGLEYTYKSVVNEFGGAGAAISDASAIAGMAEEYRARSKTNVDDAAAISAIRAGVPDEAGFKALVQKKKAEIHPQQLFSDFLRNPVKQVVWYLVFMGLTVLLVLGGVSGGIERGNKIMMPLLLLMLVVLAVRVLTLDGGSRVIGYLFKPDFSTISGEMVLAAMGQAFFSLSVGMGALLTYGSYLGKDDRIDTAAYAIPIIDTSVALLASVVVCGSIFAFGLVMTGSGTGNVFTAIPVIFHSMPGGRWLVIMFYLLVVLAALTSTISLLEVVAAYLIDEKKMARRNAVLAAASGITALGIACALSFNVLSGVSLSGMSIFDILDYFCSNIALPVGGILIAIFVGWVMKDREKQAELAGMPKAAYRTWSILLRFVAPIAIAAVFAGQFLLKL